jgi:hypothetical protein
VAWHKKNAVRRIGTQRNCGQQSKLTAARIKMTRHARVAWRRENFVRKDCTRAKDERATQGVGPLRKNLRMHHEGKCGTKDLCGGQSLYLRKERRSTNGIGGRSSGQQSHLGSGVTLKKILYAIFREKVAKQVVGTSGRLRRMKKWTLWRGRPLQNEKRNCRYRSKSRICGSTGHSMSCVWQTESE